MLAQDRYKKILELLEKDNSVKVSTLTRLFNVSVETIRRDLEHLEGEGYLKRVHGGAVLEKIGSIEMNFSTREKEYQEQKLQIGEIASRFVKEGQSIALDVSTTNFELAKVLKKNFNKLNILTNSLSIAMELSDMENYTIILSGGILRSQEYSLIGELAENNMGNFHVDTAFISISGISLREGLSDYGFGEVRVKRKMMQIAQEVIIVADSSKFDTVSLLNVCDFSDINMIITDADLKPGILEKYLKQGIEIVNA